MHSVVKSIYLLLGKYAEPEVTEENYCSHADQIFNSLDRGQKGFVTVDEFCESCSKVSLYFCCWAGFLECSRFFILESKLTVQTEA